MIYMYRPLHHLHVSLYLELLQSRLIEWGILEEKQSTNIVKRGSTCVTFKLMQVCPICWHVLYYISVYLQSLNKCIATDYSTIIFAYK